VNVHTDCVNMYTIYAIYGRLPGVLNVIFVLEQGGGVLMEILGEKARCRRPRGHSKKRLRLVLVNGQKNKKREYLPSCNINLTIFFQDEILPFLFDLSIGPQTPGE
jgi:hypothetical protein